MLGELNYFSYIFLMILKQLFHQFVNLELKLRIYIIYKKFKFSSFLMVYTFSFILKLHYSSQIVNAYS